MLIFNSNARLAVIYNMPKRGKSQNLGTIKHTQPSCRGLVIKAIPSKQCKTMKTLQHSIP